MKKLFLLFLFIPALSFGQNFEIGLGAGASTNTAPLGQSLPAGASETGFKISYAGSFSIFFNLSNWQLGLCAEAYPLKTKSDVTTTVGSEELHQVTTNHYADPQVPILLKINRLFYMRKAYFYAGIAGWSGVNLLKDSTGSMYYNELQPVLGVQLGYTYGFNDWIGANAELAARCNGSFDKPILSFPLTVGLRFRL